MSIKDRFKMVMDREKLTAGAFAESIGVAQATITGGRHVSASAGRQSVLRPAGAAAVRRKTGNTGADPQPAGRRSSLERCRQAA